MGQGRVQRRDVLLARALLRPVDGGGALGPGERVVHVAGEDHLRTGEPWVQAREVGGGQVAQRPAARCERCAGGVQEAGPEGGEHARAAVGRGAAADAEDDGGRARVQRRAQQFAGAVRGGRERREAAFREVLEAGRLGHLDHGRAVLVEREGGRHRIADGAGDPDLVPGEARRQGGRDRAVAAVRDRDGLHRQAGDGPAQSGGDVPGDLGGRERALEFVRRDQHPRCPALVCRRCPCCVRHCLPLLSNWQSRRCDLIRHGPRRTGSGCPGRRANPAKHRFSGHSGTP